MLVLRWKRLERMRGISSKELLDWEEILGRRFFDAHALSSHRRLQIKCPSTGMNTSERILVYRYGDALNQG